MCVHYITGLQGGPRKRRLLAEQMWVNACVSAPSASCVGHDQMLIRVGLRNERGHVAMLLHRLSIFLAKVPVECEQVTVACYQFAQI